MILEGLLALLGEQIKDKLQYRKVRVLIPAVLGMLAYGTWAFYVNRATDHQLLSAAAEGGRAFVFTSVGSLLIELCWHLCRGISKLKVRALITGFSTWLGVQGIAFSIHYSINPETVLATMSPSLVISFFYVGSYVLALSKL